MAINNTYITEVNPVQALIAYINAIKPYHSKIAETNLQYNINDTAAVTGTESFTVTWETTITQTTSHSIAIAGNQFCNLPDGTPVAIINSSPSPGNDGLYTVTGTEFITPDTTVVLLTPALPNPSANDGTLVVVGMPTSCSAAPPAPQCATPTFSPLPGVYNSAQMVTLSDTTPGALIYYTTDGSTPTTSSTLYVGPISVSMSETIKAIAVSPGFVNSNVASGIYTLNLLPQFFFLQANNTAAQQDMIGVATDGAGNVVSESFDSGLLLTQLSTNGAMTFSSVNQSGFSGGFMGSLIFNNGKWLSYTYPNANVNTTSNPALTTWPGVASAMPPGSYGGAGDGANRLVIAGDSSADCMSSFDNGVSWQGPFSMAPINAAAVNNGLVFDGTQFVLIGLDSAGTHSYVLTAPNTFGAGGPVWTSLGSQPVGTLNFNGGGNAGQTLAHGGGKYVATAQSAGGNAGFVIATTPAGLLTATIIHPMISALSAVASGCWILNNLIFLADNRGNCVGSQDGGVTWRSFIMPFTQASEYVQAMTYDPVNGVYIAYGSFGSVMGTPSRASILLHCDGPNHSTVFIDSSVDNFTMTTAGSAQISTTNPKFGTGAYNNSSGNINVLSAVYTAIKAGGPLDLNFGDFTVEGWLNWPVGVSRTGQQIVIDFTDTSPAGSWGTNTGGPTTSFRIYTQTNIITVQGFGPINTLNITTSISPTDNNWHHWALVRHNDTYTLYWDGVSGISQTINANAGTGTWCTVGTTPFLGPIQGIQFAGQLDEIRVTKGLAVYTTDFIPSGAPFTQLTGPSNPDPTSTLLLHFDGANGQTTTVDSSRHAWPMTFQGSPTPASLSTAQVKFGTTSMHCPPSGGTGTAGVTTPHNSILTINNTNVDFTVDFWVYLTGLNSLYNVFCGEWGFSGTSWLFLYQTSAGLTCFINNPSTGANILANFDSLLVGQWNHLALVRYNGGLSIYVNGVATPGPNNPYNIGTTNLANNVTDPFYVGYYPAAPTESIQGFIDEFRFVKGLAMWTSNFTPPTSPYTQ